MRGLGEVAERLRRATVQVRGGRRERGVGSGIVWSSDGLILTNAHVARAREMEVELWDGRRWSGRVTSRDPRRYLSALRIAANSFTLALYGALSTGRSTARAR